MALESKKTLQNRERAPASKQHKQVLTVIRHRELKDTPDLCGVAPASLTQRIDLFCLQKKEPTFACLFAGCFNGNSHF